MRVRTTKPPFGTQVNRGHWGFRSLRYAFAFNERLATRTFNRAFPNTQVTAASATFGNGATWGLDGIEFNGSTTAYVDCGADATMTGEMSVIVRARLNTTTGLLTFFGSNNSSGQEKHQGSLYSESAKLSYWIHGQNSNGHVIDGTATLVTGRWYTFALVRSGGTGAWVVTTYIDGVQDDTVSTTQNPDSGGAGGAAGNFRWGFAGAYTGAPLDGGINLALLWTRALTRAEVYSYSRNPWQLYVPDVDPFGGGIGGGGGGTTVPVFLHHYQQQGVA